jgi:hypothetical protein
MNTFATLKKSSGDISRLTKEIEKLNSPTQGERKEDTRFWKLERDVDAVAFFEKALRDH